MYQQSDNALHRLDSAVRLRQRADVMWRYAIRDALASRAPVEAVALRARTTIEDVLDIVDQQSADRTAPPRRSAFDGDRVKYPL